MRPLEGPTPKPRPSLPDEPGSRAERAQIEAAMRDVLEEARDPGKPKVGISFGALERASSGPKLAKAPNKGCFLVVEFGMFCFGSPKS